MPEHIVKSFNLDHTKVVAPFIRLSDELTGPEGDVITKLDLRFTQPNREFMDMPSMHTLEHLLATYLREGEYDIIDFSPMGCQTGFYAALWGRVNLAGFKDFFISCVEKVLSASSVPGAEEKECGNYKSHSLEGAKKYARQFLSGDIKLM